MTGSLTPKVERKLHQIPSHQNRKVVHTYLVWHANRHKPQTQLSMLDAIVALARRLDAKSWKSASRNDIVFSIRDHTYRKGEHNAKTEGPRKALAETTQYQWVMHLKAFYRHVDAKLASKLFEELPFRKAPAIEGRGVELALEPHEVGQLVAGAQTPRDLCIILTLVECGFRVSEAAALRLDHIEQRDGAYWLTLPRDEPMLKRGPRVVAVPIICSKTELEAWLASHPRRHDVRAPLFVSLSPRNFGHRMTGRTISDIVVRCAKRSGLRKLHAHMLRHTSATLKIAKGDQPELIRLTHGWTKNSTMINYYSHVKPHYERLMLEARGLKSSSPTLANILGAIACQLCGHVSPIGSANCQACRVQLSQAGIESEKRHRTNLVLEHIVPRTIDALRDVLFLAVARARGFKEAKA